MLHSSGIIRVFVSSTFADFVAERDVLQREVFPRLRTLTAGYGFSFQAVDLRWGIAADAARDHSIVPICLEEIRRSQLLSPRPNFLLMLGDRYGWRPLPHQIIAAQLDTLLSRATLPTDRRQMLLDWYRRDDNAVAPVYALRARDADSGELDAERWKEIETDLHETLSVLLDDPAIAPMLARVLGRSATHIEIEEGILSAEGAEEHVHCFFRTPATPVEITSDRAAVEALKATLRERLGSNIHELTSSSTGEGVDGACLQRFASEAYDALAQIIERQLAGPARVLGAATSGDPSFLREADAHLKFEAARAARFIGRSDATTMLENDVLASGTSGAEQLTVVTGTSGLGKTSLLASLASRQRNALSGTVTIARYLGVTARSTDGRQHLADLCIELDRAFHRGPIALR